MLRIARVEPLDKLRVRLMLTDGTVIERDLTAALSAPVFAPLRDDPDLFGQVSVEDGTLVWPNGLDLCPDMAIWGGAPPMESATKVS